MGVMTTIAVVQAGVSLYQAFNSKGSGIGDMLAAQTEMLVAIQKHLYVIGQQTEQIYRDVTWIKEQLPKIPSETARSVYALGSKSSILRANELLSEFTYDLERVGREKALFDIKKRAESLISELQTNRSALLSESNEASTPLLVALWDTELSLLMNCVEIDVSRILFALKSYKTWFSSTSKNILEPMIENLNQSIDDIITNQIKNEAKNNANNFGEIKVDCPSISDPRVVNFDCKVIWYNYLLTFEKSEFEGDIVKLIHYRDELYENGAPITSSQYENYVWKSTNNRHKKKMKVSKIEKFLKGSHWKKYTDYGKHDKFINEDKKASIKKLALLEKLCIYGNFYLLIKHALNTISQMEAEIVKWEEHA